MIDDAILTLSVAMAAAFLVLSAFLLAKYKILSNELTGSNDLGENLFAALDARLKKQDERILDVMARVDVFQSAGSQPRTLFEKSPSKSTDVAIPKVRDVVEPQIIPEDRIAVLRSLEPTENVVLKLLAEKPRTSVEIKALINKSREHTARLMKSLFDRGLVGRNDSKKPFVYQVTEQGRRYFSEA